MLGDLSPNKSGESATLPKEPSDTGAYHVG